MMVGENIVDSRLGLAKMPFKKDYNIEIIKLRNNVKNKKF